MDNFVKGTITNIFFQNEDNGYTVGLIKVKETNDSELNNYKGRSLSFVGTFHNLIINSNYTFYGNTTIHKKYGFQYQVNSYDIAKLEKKDELIEFLSCDIFPIGVRTAKKIVETFPEKTIEKILENPNNLLLIPRISQDKALAIHTKLKEYEESNEIILFLGKLGFSMKQALIIHNKYKEKTISKLENNIYELLDDFDKFTFQEIDRAAGELKILDDDERRIKALIIYVINDYTFNTGDTYLSFDDILKVINKYINITDVRLDNLLMELDIEEKIVIENDKYYLKKFYDAENYIATRIEELANDYKNKVSGIDKGIKLQEKFNNIKYDETQKKAIIASLTNNITIITGGPGTGKTTIIKAIVSLIRDIFKANPNDIALLAPTGRASKKMAESVNFKASTIHRFLKWDKESENFAVNEYSKASEKYIIVDEVSMIDTILFESLLKGLKRGVKLILVGDHNQLPSISQGQILEDLIDSKKIETIFLSSLYRQSDDSYIVTLAKEIKDKDISVDFNKVKSDYNFIASPKEYILNNVKEIVSKAINKGYTDKDIQILIPMYKTEYGIDNFNVLLKELFNPKSPKKNEIEIGDVLYREGDKVIQLVNEIENNVFNGDVGYIKSISNNSKLKEIIIDFDGNLVTYKPSKMINIRHGYAVSIHKSQGSEFNLVIMPFVNSYKRMLYNKLIYTGVTRAKKSLILIGDKNLFLYAVDNDYITNRKTSLKNKLIDKIKDV